MHLNFRLGVWLGKLQISKDFWGSRHYLRCSFFISNYRLPFFVNHQLLHKVIANLQLKTFSIKVNNIFRKLRVTFLVNCYLKSLEREWEFWSILTTGQRKKASGRAQPKTIKNEKGRKKVLSLPLSLFLLEGSFSLPSSFFWYCSKCSVKVITSAFISCRKLR